MTRPALAALVAMLLSGCTCYSEKKDLSYDPTNVPYGVFDLYRPTCGGDGPFPALVYTHGGAFMAGDKAEADYIAKIVCPEGIAVVSVNYRLTAPQGPTPGSPWPAQLQDIQKALAYVRANAAMLKLDPNRLGSCGVSAGGCLAAMLCLRNPDPLPVGCILDGEADFTYPPDKMMTNFDDITAKLIGHPKPWTPAELLEVSPVHFARKDVHAFVLHGERDNNIFVPQGDAQAAALKAAGADVVYVRLPGSRGECHGKCLDDPEARDEFLKFLRRTLLH
jgi:acetyl esterase/lipase